MILTGLDVDETSDPPSTTRTSSTGLLDDPFLFNWFVRVWWRGHFDIQLTPVVRAPNQSFKTSETRTLASRDRTRRVGIAAERDKDRSADEKVFVLFGTLG